MEIETQQNPNDGLYEWQYLLDNSVIGQSELIQVIEGRKLFLQKIESNDVNREDFLEHIESETKLLEALQHNIELRSRVEEMQSDDTRILNMLINRIDFLYFSMLQMSPIRLSSMKRYLKFRSDNKSYINDTTFLRKLMSSKHNDPEVYKITALFEYYNMSDINAARLCFSEGLKYHKHCKKLHVDNFSLEVQYNEDTDGESFPIALSKYKNMIKCFKGDLEFHFTLLDASFKSNSVSELHYHVVRDMIEEYKGHEKMWQKLAIINLNGFIFDSESELICFDRHRGSGITYTYKAFDDGLKVIWSPVKRKLLWNMFIEHVINIWKEFGVKNTIASFVNENMERVFQGAFNEGFLYKAEHYAYWAEHKNEECDEILSKAIRMNKDNLNVWIEILTVYIESDSFEMAYKVFQDAIKSLESNSIPLWELMEKFIIDFDQNSLLDFYQQASYVPWTQISLIYRVKYLNFFGMNNGITAIRRLFKELNSISPPCKQLYVEMISYERSLSTVNVTQVSKLYNEVCYNLGHGDIELWANYIQFEYMNVERYTAKNIYKSSMEYLGPELFDVLTTEFENIKSEFEKTLTINPEVIKIDE
ncbi:uncharacterized protein LOC113557844, partial [Rhopalosiphum maidis]|uniref:uncharacterized protein LOC113557844 n=1 Tax=Rhopalosiphum maidis TaxID=43146 RepID=UPI000EFEBDDD